MGLLSRHQAIGHRFIRSVTLCIAVAALMSTDGGIVHARKELLTPQEKEQLRRAERIHLDLLALTERGPVDPGALASAATGRLQALGYRVVPLAEQPADVIVKIKCEDRKTWEGTGLSGGDADMVDAAARLWTGPACQISYRFGGRMSDWRHEVRSESAMQQVSSATGQGELGAAAIASLTARLAQDDFPFLLAAEWDQPARLVAALDAPGTTLRQKQVLIGLMGNMGSVDTIPRLSAALKDPDPAVAAAAANALGTIGQAESIPALLALFKSGTPEQHRIAAIGLGRLAPLHPATEIVPTLLASLPTEPVPTQILLVRALGKTTDRRVVEPLRTLHRSVLKLAPGKMTPEFKELKTALEIALDQFDGTHTSE